MISGMNPNKKSKKVVLQNMKAILDHLKISLDIFPYNFLQQNKGRFSMNSSLDIVHEKIAHECIPRMFSETYWINFWNKYVKSWK